MAISKDFYKAKSKSKSSLGSGAYYEAKDAQPVEDKSAAIWAKTIENIGVQTSKIIDNKAAQESQKRKDAKALMDRTMKYTLDETTRVYDNLQELGVNNPSIFKNADVLLQERFGYYSRAAGAKTQEEQKIALDELSKTTKQLTSLETLITQGQESSKLYGDDVNDGNLLGQGTLNLSGEKNLQWAKMMNIRNGINEGTEEWGMDENGDWTITYDGPELGGPVTQKAALFFGYDPGKIPETDKFFNELFIKVGAINEKGEATDKYLDPNQIIQSTNDKGYSQVAYNVNTGRLATDTAQQIGAYAKGMTHDLSEAEAAWDNNFPEDIKAKVAKKYGVEDYSDLQGGAGAGYGQLNKISGQMFVEAMQLTAGTKMPNQKLGNVVKNTKPPASGTGLKEMQRTQEWKLFKDDFDIKAGLFNMGVNDSGVYEGELDLKELGPKKFQAALQSIGWTIENQKVIDGGDDQEDFLIGLKIKPNSGYGKPVTVSHGMDGQNFVEALLQGMKALPSEARRAGYEYNKELANQGDSAYNNKISGTTKLDAKGLYNLYKNKKK